MTRLFASGERLYTEQDLGRALAPLALGGRTVLLYSRLLSFGRILDPEVVARVLHVFMDAVGPEGTLCVPAYTFSAYRGEPFDPDRSKSRVGVLGDVARSLPAWVRTMHPVYSTVCWGKHAQTLLGQDPRTCFGPGSFFDLFAGRPDSCIVMLGTNLSAVTLAHYYDQMFGAPGRFLKVFRGALVQNGRTTEIEFESFVKDEGFYGGRMPCLGRLDVVAGDLGLVERRECMGDWVHGIRESDFRRLYRACVQVDPEYFLLSSTEEFRDYYEKNQFRLFYGSVPRDRIEAVVASLD